METPEDDNANTTEEAVEALEAVEAGTTGEAEAADADADAVAEPVEPPKAKGPAPRPSRTPEQRHAERLEERKAKAVARRRRRVQERDKARVARTEVPANVPPVERPSGAPKVRQGIVVSDKADKTITVRVDVARRHRRYEKIVRSSVTLHAHDEANDANAGDTVRVVESRPLSATKRWRLTDVLERAR